MRIIFCGVPDSGKQDFYLDLYHRYDLPGTSDVNAMMEELYDDRAPTMGFLSDYRFELFLATFRAMEHMMEKDMVFMHSLIDSIAYATTITALKIQTEDSELNSWFSAFQFFPKLIEDSFLYDLVIRFPYAGEDEMMKILDSNLELALKTYEVPYTLHTDLDTIYSKIEEEHHLCDDWANGNQRTD